MLKVNPHLYSPPEESCQIRGNDRSPVAVVIILKLDQDKSYRNHSFGKGWSRSGCRAFGYSPNGIGRPRKSDMQNCFKSQRPLLLLRVSKSHGHLTGGTVRALFKNGVDSKNRTLGIEAPHLFMFNIKGEMVGHFLAEVKLVDFRFRQDVDLLKKKRRYGHARRRSQFNSWSMNF